MSLESMKQKKMAGAGRQPCRSWVTGLWPDFDLQCTSWLFHPPVFLLLAYIAPHLFNSKANSDYFLLFEII